VGVVVPWIKSKGEEMNDTDIHSCGYYCDRHACIVAQRNELRDTLFEGQAVKTYSGNKPNYTQPEEKFYKQAVDGTIPEAYSPAKGGLLPKREPSGSWILWDNTMCNPFADARMQTQSAWQDGYESAKADVREIAFGETKPIAWDVWTVHNHVFFSIGVQTFQISDVLEHDPEVSAKEFSEWLAIQLRHALTQLSNTARGQG